MLHLVFRGKMQIIVKTTSRPGNIFPLTVDPTDTVLCVKTKISVILRVPQSLQKLFIDGKKLDDSKMLKFCGVKSGSTLQLTIPPLLTVSIANGQKAIQVRIYPDEKIRHLKHEINEKLEVPVEQQRLFYQDRLLEDDCTLSSYGVDADSLIHMSKCCMKVFTEYHIQESVEDNSSYSLLAVVYGLRKMMELYVTVFNGNLLAQTIQI